MQFSTQPQGRTLIFQQFLTIIYNWRKHFFAWKKVYRTGNESSVDLLSVLFTYTHRRNLAEPGNAAASE